MVGSLVFYFTFEHADKGLQTVAVKAAFEVIFIFMRCNLWVDLWVYPLLDWQKTVLVCNLYFTLWKDELQIGWNSFDIASSSLLEGCSHTFSCKIIAGISRKNCQNWGFYVEVAAISVMALPQCVSWHLMSNWSHFRTLSWRPVEILSCPVI